MRVLFRVTLLVTVACGLGGCAAPGVLTLVSLGANGVSYAVSGKSISDHALSAALARDCALWRVLNGGQICAPEVDVSEMLAVATTAGATRTPTDRPDPLAPASVLAPRRRSGPVASAGDLPLVDEQHGTWPPAQLTSAFAVIGSFAVRANAQALAARATPYAARVVAAQTPAGLRFRVVATAFDRARLTGAALEAAGYADSWTVQLCSEDLSPPPCAMTTLIAGRD